MDDDGGQRGAEQWAREITGGQQRGMRSAVQRGIAGAQSCFYMLCHHDHIVDDEAHGRGHATERHHVQ